MCLLTIYSQKGSHLKDVHLLEHKSDCSSIQDSFLAPISLGNKSLQGLTWSDSTLLSHWPPLHSGLLGSVLGPHQPGRCSLGLLCGVFPLSRTFISQGSAWAIPSCCSSLCSKTSFQRGPPWPPFPHSPLLASPLPFILLYYLFIIVHITFSHYVIYFFLRCVIQCCSLPNGL